MDDFKQQLEALFREAALAGPGHTPWFTKRAMGIVREETTSINAKLALVTVEKERLDKEFSKVLTESTRRIGEIAMLREKNKRLVESLGEERGKRVEYDKALAPRSGSFNDECVGLIHKTCLRLQCRWSDVLTMWAGEMVKTGQAADVVLRRMAGES
jgi:hypothetical protein